MPLPAHTTAGARLGAATARDEQDGSAALKPRETLNRDLEQKPSTRPRTSLPPRPRRLRIIHPPPYINATPHLGLTAIPHSPPLARL